MILQKCVLCDLFLFIMCLCCHSLNKLHKLYKFIFDSLSWDFISVCMLILRHWCKYKLCSESWSSWSDQASAQGGPQEFHPD